MLHTHIYIAYIDLVFQVTGLCSLTYGRKCLSIKIRNFLTSIVTILFKHFWEVWSCFKFNSLGLALGMVLKFYTNATKFQSFFSFFKVSKFQILTFVDFAGRQTGMGAFLPPLSRHPE